MRFPCDTALLSVNGPRGPHRGWWRSVRGGRATALFGLDPAIDRMLEDPDNHPEAAVGVRVAERFMDLACGVPGWDDSEPDDEPVRFTDPDRLERQEAEWRRSAR